MLVPGCVTQFPTSHIHHKSIILTIPQLVHIIHLDWSAGHVNETNDICYLCGCLVDQTNYILTVCCLSYLYIGTCFMHMIYVPKPITIKLMTPGSHMTPTINDSLWVCYIIPHLTTYITNLLSWRFTTWSNLMHLGWASWHVNEVNFRLCLAMFWWVWCSNYFL